MLDGSVSGKVLKANRGSSQLINVRLPLINCKKREKSFNFFLLSSDVRLRPVICRRGPAVCGPATMCSNRVWWCWLDWTDQLAIVNQPSFQWATAKTMRCRPSPGKERRRPSSRWWCGSQIVGRNRRPNANICYQLQRLARQSFPTGLVTWPASPVLISSIHWSSPRRNASQYEPVGRC